MARKARPFRDVDEEFMRCRVFKHGWEPIEWEEYEGPQPRVFLENADYIPLRCFRCGAMAVDIYDANDGSRLRPRRTRTPVDYQIDLPYPMSTGERMSEQRLEFIKRRADIRRQMRKP